VIYKDSGYPSAVDRKSKQGTLTKEVLERKYTASFEECEKKNKTNILKGGT